MATVKLGETNFDVNSLFSFDAGKLSEMIHKLVEMNKINENKLESIEKAQREDRDRIRSVESEVTQIKGGDRNTEFRINPLHYKLEKEQYNQKKVKPFNKAEQAEHRKERKNRERAKEFKITRKDAEYKPEVKHESRPFKSQSTLINPNISSSEFFEHNVFETEKDNKNKVFLNSIALSMDDRPILPRRITSARAFEVKDTFKIKQTVESIKSLIKQETENFTLQPRQPNLVVRSISSKKVSERNTTEGVAALKNVRIKESTLKIEAHKLEQVTDPSQYNPYERKKTTSSQASFTDRNKVDYSKYTESYVENNSQMSENPVRSTTKMNYLSNDKATRSSIVKNMADIDGLKDTAGKIVKEEINEVLSELFKKMAGLESELASIKAIPKRLSLSDYITQIQMALPRIQTELEVLRKKQDENVELTEELAEKLGDFDLIEVIRNKSSNQASDSNQPIDESLVGVKILEKRVYKKIKLLEEKVNSADTTAYQVKNEFSNLNRENELLFSKLNLLENEFTQIGRKLEDEEETNKERKEQLDHLQTIQASVKAKLNNFDDKLEQRSEIERSERGESSERIKIAVSSLPEREIKLLNKIQAKQIELEAKFEATEKNNRQDTLQNEISALKGILKDKADFEEITGIKKAISTLKANCIDNLEDINIIRENFDFNDSINKLYEQVELLGLKVRAVNHRTSVANTGESAKEENTSYVYQKVFENFVKEILDKVETNREEIGSLKSQIDQTLVELQAKPDKSSLEGIKAELLDKLALLAKASSQRYANRDETEKNIRFLDHQFRHIDQHYVRRYEKGKESLIMNRKWSGNRCGSCDQPVAENKEGYALPWNQLNGERLYRAGNGFSRILGMMDNEAKYESDSGTNKRKLPKVKRSSSEINFKQEIAREDSDGPKMCFVK